MVEGQVNSCEMRSRCYCYSWFACPHSRSGNYFKQREKQRGPNCKIISREKAMAVGIGADLNWPPERKGRHKVLCLSVGLYRVENEPTLVSLVFTKTRTPESIRPVLIHLSATLCLFCTRQPSPAQLAFAVFIQSKQAVVFFIRLESTTGQKPKQRPRSAKFNLDTVSAAQALFPPKKRFPTQRPYSYINKRKLGTFYFPSQIYKMLQIIGTLSRFFFSFFLTLFFLSILLLLAVFSCTSTLALFLVNNSI